MPFLGKLMRDVADASLDGVEPPNEEAEEGDCIIGALSGELVGLYVAMTSASAKTREAYHRLKMEIDGFGKSKISAEQEQLMYNVYAGIELEDYLIRRMFQTCLHLEFRQFVSDDIVLRKDWQLVVRHSQARTQHARSRFANQMV